MDDFECQASMALQRADDRGDFHKIRPSSCDQIYFFHPWFKTLKTLARARANYKRSVEILPEVQK
jgi:hypothetical protein